MRGRWSVYPLPDGRGSVGARVGWGRGSVGARVSSGGYWLFF